MSDIYQLARFLDAQHHVYTDVVRELSQGRKSSHWMWYIFPQIKGLGQSQTAQKYALGSLEEANAYLQHPVLGHRLNECTEIVVNTQGHTVEQIFGYPDYLKFHSSMTLFIQVENHNPVFDRALSRYFEGRKDQMTLNILNESRT